jgi:predicted ATPase
LQAIPPTLQQSLAARLDRLGAAREIAQIGAILGRDFSYALLRAVGGVDEPALQSALDRLAGADLLVAKGAGHEATYRFKHALIQDAAYESLLKSRRRALHRRVANLLRDASERAAAEPEVIAHHFTEAGLDDEAIEWWGRAGAQALRRSAFQEAIAHLGKAITLADKAAAATTATSPESKPSRRAKLQTDYAQALFWSKGFAAQETEAAFARAGELAQQSANNAERYQVYYGRWVQRFLRGELNSARETAEEFLSAAVAERRTTEEGVARRLLGLTNTWRGDLIKGKTQLDRALHDYVRSRDASSRLIFGTDNGVSTASQLAVALWHLGEITRARQLVEQSIMNANDLDHAASNVHAHYIEAGFEAYRRDPRAALRSARLLVELSQAHRMDFHAAAGEVFASWARGRLGFATAGVEKMRKAIETFAKPGNRIWLPLFHGLLAELQADTRDANAALGSIEKGLSISEQTCEHHTDSFLHRLRADTLLRRDPADPRPAEGAYRTAIAIAKQQGARSYELLASLSLAKLYESTGRPAEAMTVLVPALEGFSPSAEMPEIAEAKALLERLA